MPKELEEKIINKIRDEGPITFENFMEMALYDPEYGYYSSPKQRIGKSGDYYTSQHVHKLFGFMLGKQIHEMWEIMNKPNNFKIVEIGAGEGHMCKDICEYLLHKNIIESFKYIIIESNRFVQNKQKILLEDYSKYIDWSSSFDDLKMFSGCLLSNELLDSFPVHIIEMKNKLYEVYVDFDGSVFFEILGNLSKPKLREYLDEFSITLPQDYRTEINLRIKDWLNSVDKKLQHGFLITIDYGFSTHDYYAQERNKGTLLCYYKHTLSENPYDNIGDQDITAHINFSSLKKWAEDLGFKTIGFCQQGTYLVSLGIDEFINEYLISKKDYLYEIAKIKRLLLPGTLGETHKVLIQYKGPLNPILKGFSIRNQKDNL
jgi:SAM-dependent MidA family methyltransferase